MAKLISVADDVYDELKELKGNESFSVTIRRYLPKSRNKELLKLSGSLKDPSFFKAMKSLRKEKDKPREVVF